MRGNRLTRKQIQNLKVGDECILKMGPPPFWNVEAKVKVVSQVFLDSEGNIKYSVKILPGGIIRKGKFAHETVGSVIGATNSQLYNLAK